MNIHFYSLPKQWQFLKHWLFLVTADDNDVVDE